MPARLLDGRPVADALWPEIESRSARFAERADRPPTLALVSGADESAEAYARQIERQLTRRGLRVVIGTPSAAEYEGHVRGLGDEATIDGVVLLTPLPSGVDAEEAVAAIDPTKDVDGQHPLNLGLLAQRRMAFAPATALGGLMLLQHYEIPLRGARIVVVGRSPVVGMPLALLLIDADATVTVCHSRSGHLSDYTRDADVLCVAAGRGGLIGAEHVKAGAVVVDFGTNPTHHGSLIGDVQTAAVAEVASAITPVPGGTGPMTVAVLAYQTLRAAELRRDDE